jgi:hypothetical protein
MRIGFGALVYLVIGVVVASTHHPRSSANQRAGPIVRFDAGRIGLPGKRKVA